MEDLVVQRVAHPRAACGQVVFLDGGTIVTDQRLPEETAAAYRRLGVALLLA